MPRSILRLLAFSALLFSFWGMAGDSVAPVVSGQPQTSPASETVAAVATAAPQSPEPGSDEECQPASADFFLTYKRPPLPQSPFRLWSHRLLDVAVFSGLLGVVLWMVLTRRRRIWLLGLAAVSVAYLGFYRQGCLCSVGAIGNVAQALTHPKEFLEAPPPPPPQKEVELPGGLVLVAENDAAGVAEVPETHAGVLSAEGVVFFFLPLLAALLAGRIFCGAVCPFGALQELLSWKAWRVPHWLERILKVGPWLMLAWAVLSAWRWFGLPICLVDPFVPLFRLAVAHPAVWVFSGAFLLLCGFVYRPYCRWLCPYGVLLSLLTRLAWRRRTLDESQCRHCGKCPRACLIGAIQKEGPKPGVPSLDAAACVECGRCSEVCKAKAIR